MYDGASLNLPTWHGVVVRESYAQQHPEVVDAFLQAQTDATQYLNSNPMAAALSVAKQTKLPAEVVYLYNGPNGMVTFDTALKPELKDALEQDIPFLESIGNIKRLDLNAFWDPSYLDRVKAPIKPAQISGVDPVCGIPAANPTCLLRQVAKSKVRVAYVPSTDTGTRWFADKSVWVQDTEYLPFSTEEGARRYVAGHPGAHIISYAKALEGSR
ncbi:hypothetical protein LWC34_25960 [Kibdelosporangium philippinense]|uniref:Uncharacterized protein n=1 Tax=Kibdelosporangium philippinense TaxID=211113 RepID=A0ABS8ZII3_9PSEU|nr:hypothetical protein [Kibdelosporangium philippinense]MCE7006258.1 hypothetical protein [Kibdelosporangium philippinense]